MLNQQELERAVLPGGTPAGDGAPQTVRPVLPRDLIRRQTAALERAMAAPTS
ncbi:hypothetical protein [Streptomyces sp. NPDC052225]|uniref:hypothetical protein n=1 Tax=Streptomyces sp. NPDC052225 TaxID=3154949 RepID=UPI00341A3C48